MKLATFQAPGGEPRPAVVEGDEVVELPYPDLIAFLEAGGDPGALDGPRHPLAAVRLLAPVPRPGSIRDAMTFEST